MALGSFFSRKPKASEQTDEAPKVSHLTEAAKRAAQKFIRFNVERRAKLESQVSERAVQVLQALPYLLHVNIEGLPGYMGDTGCPYGVAAYEPTGRDIELVGKLFPNSNPRRAAVPRMAVDLIAVMGSAGSIGFAEGSDLDIWVCFRMGDHGAEGLALYTRKVHQIEAWMNKHSGVEIHLFVQATEHIRANNFGETDLEGCGSALGALLKEEFYRTAIVLAGRHPFWWVTPPDTAVEIYRKHIEKLRADPSFEAAFYVDLGPVQQVVLGELFGAAIWQIAKGQKSPFKSALKMGYLEKTVCSGRSELQLCELLKTKVLEGERPDPYRLLFDVVLEYYDSNSDLAAQELLAECFYLKTGGHVDPNDLEPSSDDEVQAALCHYVKSWGWGKRKVARLNDFSSWKFEWIKDLSGDLNRFFMRSYKRIHEAMEQAGGARAITDRDLTVIGRKLQVAYRNAAYKMERVHILPGVEREMVLSLIEAPLADGTSEWRLYRGVVNNLTEEENLSNLIRSFSDVVELMMWAAYNAILGEKTRLLCRPVSRSFSSADLEALAPDIVAFLEEGDALEHSTGELLKESLPTRLMVVPNMGREEDDIVEIAVIYQTSWGETFYRHFEGTEAMRKFADLILFSFCLDAPDPTAIQVYAPRRKVKALTGPSTRLQKWMPRLVEMFSGQEYDPLERKRFVMITAEGFAIIEREKRDFNYKVFPTFDGLRKYMSTVGPHDRVVTKVDVEDNRLGELVAIFDAAKVGRVDIFFAEGDRDPRIYLVDEVGNLFYDDCAADEGIYELAKLLFFLESAIPDIRQNPSNPMSKTRSSECMEIHRLSTVPVLRTYTARQEYYNAVSQLGLNPMGLTIERMPAAQGAAGYVIIWGNEIIKSGEVAHPLEELKRRISAKRSPGGDYGVYVTRLFLDEQFIKKSCGSFPTSCHYLFYKNAIETRLNS